MTYGYGRGRPASRQPTGTSKAAIGYVRSRQPNAFPSNCSSPENAPKASSPTNSTLTTTSTQRIVGHRNAGSSTIYGSRGETNVATAPDRSRNAPASATKRKVTSLSPGSRPSFEPRFA